ncbi:histidine phosphatase family protein [Agromyces marinus]|uniref:Phosphoglycerate mutase n=1 Tax=Agromyces marinus TaxID=1389020 RepID=A0ABN6YBC7_9MICO|nr:histidine phosphatase family protein [Agromyces marinus]UIP57392.1 Phosphoserine phosphatase 1 [Agromyces marinus]BDZ54493.1 phosphoglycerate mutase [Agromyces marinus]
MTTLFLARHGETVWHREHRYAGSSDIALTPFGLEQAEGLARWAADAGLSAIVSSTLVRARHTAEPAASAAGLSLRTDSRLSEIDFGSGEGLGPNELAEQMPAEWAAFQRHPARQPLPGGEAGVDGVARAAPALLDLVREFGFGDETVGGSPESRAGHRVLVVMHGTLMRLLLCHWLGIEPDHYRDVFPAVENCALTQVRFERLGGRMQARLLGFNLPATR